MVFFLIRTGVVILLLGANFNTFKAKDYQTA